MKSEKGKIIVFSAPSGAGKSTLLTHLANTVPNLVYSISATTRNPRDGEVDGTHYFFLTKDEFVRRRDNGEFAEWQEVHGNYYGTPREFIDSVTANGKHVIMDIDVFGKKKFDTVYPEAIGILIVPPSMEILEQRLRSRATDSDDVIALRLENAKTEMNVARTEGKYEYEVVNDDLEVAKEKVCEVVREIIK